MDPVVRRGEVVQVGVDVGVDGGLGGPVDRPAGRPAPAEIPPNLLGIAGVRALPLEVVEVGDVGPRFRRVVLGGDALGDLEVEPGQDLMLVLDASGARPLSRRYTIRRLDRDGHRREVEVDIVAHGVAGPGARWAADARPGDRVNGVGPRGKIFVDREAEWHLFLGDETAAPGALAMLEAIPPDVPAIAHLEIDGPASELSHAAGDRVRWLHRGETAARSSTLLADALAATELPSGRGRVYLSGELGLVSALRRQVLEQGMDPSLVHAKAYWARGKENARHGEPDEKPS